MSCASWGVAFVCALCLPQTVGAAFEQEMCTELGQGLRAAKCAVLSLGSRGDPEFSLRFCVCILLSPGEL